MKKRVIGYDLARALAVFGMLGMGVLEAIGRLENQTLPFTLIASLVFCVASVVFAHLWRKRFERGPLEAIMRTLTDPKKAVPERPA